MVLLFLFSTDFPSTKTEVTKRRYISYLPRKFHRLRLVTCQGDPKNLLNTGCADLARILLYVHYKTFVRQGAGGVCSKQNDKSASCLNSFQFLLASPQVSGFSFKQAREPQREGREMLWHSSATHEIVEIIVKMKRYKMGRAFVVVSLLTSMIGLLLLMVLTGNADGWGLKE